MHRTSTDRWHAQVRSERNWPVAGQRYTLCYRARSIGGERTLVSYVDRNGPVYQRLAPRGAHFTVQLTEVFQDFQHSFNIDTSDVDAGVAFDMAQDTPTVQISEIGLYEGEGCGEASHETPLPLFSHQNP